MLLNRLYTPLTVASHALSMATPICKNFVDSLCSATSGWCGLPFCCSQCLSTLSPSSTSWKRCPSAFMIAILCSACAQGWVSRQANERNAELELKSQAESQMHTQTIQISWICYLTWLRMLRDIASLVLALLVLSSSIPGTRATMSYLCLSLTSCAMASWLPCCWERACRDWNSSSWLVLGCQLQGVHTSLTFPPLLTAWQSGYNCHSHGCPWCARRKLKAGPCLEDLWRKSQQDRHILGDTLNYTVR